MNGDREFLHEFFAGAEENLDQLEQALIGLEAQGAGGLDAGTVEGLSTLLQELKNGAGFLGLSKFFTLAEAGEPLLAAVAVGAVPLTTPVVDGLLQLTESLKALLVLAKGQGDDSGVATDDLCARLGLLAAGEGVEEALVAIAPQEPLVLTDELPAPGRAEGMPVEESVAAAMPARGEPVVEVVTLAQGVERPANVVVGPLLRRSSGKPAAWQAATLERRLHPERRGNDRRSGTRRGAANGAQA